MDIKEKRVKMSSNFPSDGFTVLKDAQLVDIFIPQKRSVRQSVKKLAKRSFFRSMRFIDENLDPKHD